LSGATALVTGASGGLGGHIARALAGSGTNLVLSGRDRQALDRLAGELSNDRRVEVVPADLAEDSAAERLLASVEDALGPVDVLVNNAGIEITSRYENVTGEEIEGQVAVNLTAPMLLTRGVLPGMLERGRGHVVNVASLAGKAFPPFQAGYDATKAAMIAFTHALRGELRNRPVGASVICPGFVARDGMYGRMEEMGFRAPPALGVSEPKDVADAVLKAIRDDVPEQIVNPRPVRPVLMLQELAPRLVERAAPLSGVPEFFKEIARQRGRG
jgi:short-subunit dehydrogenase